MGLLSRIFRRDETRVVPHVPDSIGVFSVGGYSDAGVNVSEATALTASAVYAAVSAITNSIASLPIHVLSRKNGEKLHGHPIARVLRDEPNEYQTGIAWRETMLLQLLLWGNSYSFIERDSLGHPVALLPLRSDRTRPIRQAGRIMYETRLTSGAEFLPPEDVLHFANFSLDGITGLSPIQQAKQSIGLSLALEKFAARFFGQGCHAGGVLTVPSLKSDGMREFARRFRENYTGPDNSWKVAVLEDGMDYKPTGVDPEKSQALQQRVHQLREVARIYRLPPHKIGDLERSTFSNIEHQSIEYVQDCLLPWVTKIEAECQRKLCLEAEKPEIEVKLNLDGLLRGDFKTRLEGYAVAINSGVMTRAEARAKENLPFIAGSDVLLTPLNMTTNPTPTEDDGAKVAKVDPAATRALIEDAARRLLAKETRAVTRAARKHAGKPDEFRAWADDWFGRHEQLVARTIAASFIAAGLSGTEAEYAKQHCDESRTAVVSAFDAGNVDDLCDEFDTVRPGMVADDLLTKGNSNE